MKARAFLATLLLAASAAHAQRQTVCTITVNSPDEREVFRRHLPESRFDFVELVERGNPDWLAASCRKGVRCDVLLVSGHFAGTEFYASRPDKVETLPVDVLERAACSESCPGLFEHLKEVYLFGCDTLNPAPKRVPTGEMVRALQREGASPEEALSRAHELARRHAESASDHMRRLFAGVPVIYGFSSKAPYGRYAGPMLERFFQAGAGDVGSGMASERLRRIFAPSSMVLATGQRPGEPDADYRAQACAFHDSRLHPAQKLAAIHRSFAGTMAEARLLLDRVEKFFAGLDAVDRAHPEFAATLAGLAADTALRARYLELARDTADPAVRTRLIRLARHLGWLTAGEERAETVRMVGDLLATRSTGFGEVDLVCTLNRDGELDGQGAGIGPVAAPHPAADAALACLGDAASRSRILEALASPDESAVQVAQAYLRHRPLAGAAEIRTVALKVAAMPAGAAQARALETLARHPIDDAEVLEGLRRLFARTRSAAVQRAIAEVFLRAGVRAAPDLARHLRQHRVHGGGGVIDVLLERLEDP